MEINAFSHICSPIVGSSVIQVGINLLIDRPKIWSQSAIYNILHTLNETKVCSDGSILFRKVHPTQCSVKDTHLVII
jgi:hypothetical protein